MEELIKFLRAKFGYIIIFCIKTKKYNFIYIKPALKHWKKLKLN